MYKLLTIIIPVYNGKDYIQLLISNIEYHNADITDEIEILLINDGSTDSSLNICKDQELKYPNIKVYDKENGGIASARNCGLEKASGKYVVFIDQDDSLSKGYCAYLKELETNEADILITDEVYNKPDGIEKRGYVKTNEICDKERIEMLLRTLLCVEDNSVFTKYNCCPPTIWNCIFRTELIKKNNIELYSYVDYEDDWIFLLNTLLSANKVIFSKEPYYLWKIHETSHSHRHRYIADLETKLHKLNTYIFSIMMKVGISSEVLNKKKLLQRRDSIISVLYNATYTSYKNFKKEVSSVMDNNYSENLILKNSHSKGIILQNIYLKLFAHKVFIIPYLINRFVLQKKFH